MKQSDHSFVVFLLMLSFIWTGCASTDDTVKGLAAYYPFSGNADDTSGNRNNGIVTGAKLTAGRNKQKNDAYHFDGIHDYIIVSKSSSLNVGEGNGLTIAAWINPFDLALEQPVAEWEETGWGVHLFISVKCCSGPGSLYANIPDLSGTAHTIWTATDILTPYTYQHVAVTYDKTTGVANLYVNGDNKASRHLGIFTPRTNGYLTIGARRTTGTYFRGEMDDLRIYNRSLSHDEIAQLARRKSRWRMTIFS